MQDKDFLKLRVSEKEKTKEWYKFQALRLIPSTASVSIEDHDEMLKIYRFCNNDLTDFKSEITHYCGNLEEIGATPEELVPYNPIPNKLEVLKGELLSMGNTHKIILLTAKAHRARNKELHDLILKSVDEELRLEVERVKAQLEGMSEEEVNQYIESLRTTISPQDIDLKNFSSESEILYNKLLNYTYFSQDVQTKKLETLEDGLKVDRLFIYPGWKNGKPFIKVCNPLHIGFTKAPDVPYIQYGDYVYYRDEITVADALQEYGNKLSKEELEHVFSYASQGNPPVNKDHVTKPVFDWNKYYTLLLEDNGSIVNEKGIGLHQGDALSGINFTSTLWRYHLEFRAFKKVMFFSFTDETNSKITIMLEERTDIIPEEASLIKFTNPYGDPSEKYTWTDEQGNTYEAEILWIPRRYEVTQLGSPEVLVDYREVPFQPDNIENPFTRFELTYKGGIITSRNARFISLVQRALPSAFQYMAVKNLQDRELAAYVGSEKIIDVQQIPDELALDTEGNPIEGADKVLQQEVIARRTKNRYYDSMRTSNGLSPSPTRTLGVQHSVVDTSPQLLNLQQLAQLINVEVGLSMGISPQREALTMPNTNVTDNRQALMQSSLSTQTYFFYHDKIWQHVLNEHLYNLKMWLKNIFEQDPQVKEHHLHYVLPDGTKELLKVTPDAIEKLEDIGLYVYNTGKDKLYFDVMLQNIQPIAQNAGQGAEELSHLMKSLVSTSSVEEVHKEIQLLSKKVQERAQQQQEAQMKAQEQLKQQALELERYRAEIKLLNDLRYLDAEKEVKLEQAKIMAEQWKMQQDVNQDNRADEIEKTEIELQHEAKENALDRDLQLKLAKINAGRKRN